MTSSLDGTDLVENDDYYAWLGLHKEATHNEIEQAYRRLSKIFHPDKHTGDSSLKNEAQEIFIRLNKAHMILTDPHKKAIYDTMGMKGLETDGWELIKKTKTPHDIIREYEILKEEEELRKLQQRTNPRGNVTMDIDASDIFENYENVKRGTLPIIEVSSMTISQSIEMPLTTKNTATLSAQLNTQNGTGSGSLHGSIRRLISSKGWAELECSAGEGLGIALRGFRTLWSHTSVTMSGSMQMTSRGIRPNCVCTLAHQIDKSVQGRLTWSALNPSTLTTALVYTQLSSYFITAIQLGINNSFIMSSYTHSFDDSNIKVKGTIRVGVFGATIEYGIDKKVSKFTRLGGYVALGTQCGVNLKIKVVRGNQRFIFPIHLADSIMPSAVFYGTIVPLITFITIDKFLIQPFMKSQQKEELEKKRAANADYLSKKKKEAIAILNLMSETIEKSYSEERAKGGLVITKAVYGKLGIDHMEAGQQIRVEKALQCLVKDSKLFIAAGTKFSELPGIYDPCLGAAKVIAIRYEFRFQVHSCTCVEDEKIFLPHKDHLST